MKLETMVEAHSDSAHYWGDRPEWGIAAFQHRDSDTLTNINFDVMHEELRKVDRPEFEDEVGTVGDVEVEESRCWLVGWRRYLLVRPGSPAEAKALELRKKIEAYPVLDEERFYQAEEEEADERWKYMSCRERYNMVSDALTDDEFEKCVPNAGRIRDDEDGGMSDEDEAEFDSFWATEDWNQFDPRGMLRERLVGC